MRVEVTLSSTGVYLTARLLPGLKLYFLLISTGYTEFFDVIHSDVFGPTKTEFLVKEKYFIEFIDDDSRWYKVRFLKYKSEVLQITKGFIKMVENQKGKKVKCFQSDNGKEHTSKEYDNFLRKKWNYKKTHNSI